MSTRTFATAAAIVAALAAQGCGGDEPTAAGGASAAAADVSIDVGAGKTIEIKKGTKPKIAFFTPGPLNSFTKAYGDGAQAAAERYGVEIKEIANGFDPAKQFSQLQNELQRGRYNAWMVAPVDGNQMCKILSHQAPEKNILVSISVLGLCGRDLKPTEELWTPGTLNFLNVEDSLDYHRGWAEAVAEMLPGPSKVAVVSGPPLLTSSRTTERSFQEVRKTRPDLEIAATVRTDLTTPDALAKVQTLLQGNPDIDAILSIHPDITRGVIQALKARGKQPGDIKLFDFGASRYDVEQIKAGWLTATTIYRPRTTTEQQVKSIVDAFAGRPVQRVMPVVEPGTADRPHMLTKDNVDGFRPEW